MMNIVKIKIEDEETPCEVLVADSFLDRLIGLMFTKELKENTGLLIRPCSMVHTFFMRYSIDVVFISKGGEILELCSDLAPNGFSPHISGCYQVLEFPCHYCAKMGMQKGQQLSFII